MWDMSGCYKVSIVIFNLYFLECADVKGSKTKNKSQAYFFTSLTLMITEIIKIDGKPNLKQ